MRPAFGQAMSSAVSKNAYYTLKGGGGGLNFMQMYPLMQCEWRPDKSQSWSPSQTWCTASLCYRMNIIDENIFISLLWSLTFQGSTMHLYEVKGTQNTSKQISPLGVTGTSGYVRNQPSSWDKIWKWCVQHNTVAKLEIYERPDTATYFAPTRVHALLMWNSTFVWLLFSGGCFCKVQGTRHKNNALQDWNIVKT